MEAPHASESPPLEGKADDARDALLPLANMANAFELRDRTHLVPLWGQGTESKWNWSECWDEILKQEELDREKLKGMEAQQEVEAAKLAAAAAEAQAPRTLTQEEQAQRLLHLHAKDLIMKLYAQSQYVKTRTRLQRVRGAATEPELPSLKDLPAIGKSIAAVQALGLDPMHVLQQAGFSSKQIQLVMHVSKLAEAAANGESQHESGIEHSAEFARSPSSPLTPDQTSEVRNGERAMARQPSMSGGERTMARQPSMSGGERTTLRRPSMSSGDRATMRRPSMSTNGAPGLVVPPESLMLAAPQSFRFRRSSSGIQGASPSPPPGMVSQGSGSLLSGPAPSPSPQYGASPSRPQRPDEDSPLGTTLPGVRMSLPMIQSPRTSMVLSTAGSSPLASPLHGNLQGRSPRTSVPGVGGSGGSSILAGPSGMGVSGRMRANSNLRSSTSSLNRGMSESGAFLIQNGIGAGVSAGGSAGGAAPLPSSLPPLMTPGVGGGPLGGSFRGSFRSPSLQRVTAPGMAAPLFFAPQPPQPPSAVLGKTASMSRRQLDMDVALSMP